MLKKLVMVLGVVAAVGGVYNVGTTMSATNLENAESALFQEYPDASIVKHDDGSVRVKYHVGALDCTYDFDSDFAYKVWIDKEFGD